MADDKVKVTVETTTQKDSTFLPDSNTKLDEGSKEGENNPTVQAMMAKAEQSRLDQRPLGDDPPKS